MRIGIVVDSSCDLPKSYLEGHKINVIPMCIQGGDTPFYDYREKKTTTDFNSYIKNNKVNYEALSPTKEEIRQFFLTKIIINYDYVIFITASSYRSKTYDNAIAAVNSILTEYKPIRDNAGIRRPFQVRVIDSQTVSSGQGIVVAEVIKALKKYASPLETTQTALDIAKCTQAYVLPSDLYYLYEQAKRKGDKSVGLLEYTVASALNIKPILMSHGGTTVVASKPKGFDEGTQKLFEFAGEEIKKGLLSNQICISYGGNREKIKDFPGFAEFFKIAQQYQTELLISKMSMTAIVNVGPNSFCIAFATKN